MRILYASDVVPADTTSGAKVIHRHLTLAARSHEVLVAHLGKEPAPEGLSAAPLVPRTWMTRGLGSRRRRHFAALESVFGLRARDAELAGVASKFRAELLLTVAEGGLCQNARRVARRLGLPLAVIYHDWSPDWREHPGWSRRWIERAFLSLHRASRASLCVSAPMLSALGEKPGATVLYPLSDPASRPVPAPPGEPGPAVYAGVLNGLAEPEVRALAALCLESEAARDRLRFYGPRPNWGDGLDDRLARAGAYLGFRSIEALQPTLAAASSLLVVMPFAASARRFTLFSFPSKLVEYTRFGRPILIWGPAECSAARWAAETDAALVVSDPDPQAALAAITALADPASPEAERLGRAARRAHETDFAPELLQRKFESALEAAIRR